MKDCKIGQSILIRDLPENDFTLVTDSQDSRAIRDYIPKYGRYKNDFDSFFVTVKDGDYSQVWGFFGIVPYLNKHTTMILG